MKRWIFNGLLFLCVMYSREVLSQAITFIYDANGNCTSKNTMGTLPVVQTIGDTLVCKGAIAKLTASGANTYQWDIGGTSSKVSVIADTSRFYTVIGLGSNGCADTVQHYLKVVPIPSIASIEGDTIAWKNEIDTFTVPFHTGSFYNWTITNGILLGGNSSNQIQVQWPNAVGKGTVEVYEAVNNNMCKGQTVYKSVDIKDFPVSISGSDNVGSLNVYPNPTSNGVNIEFNSLAKNDYMLSIVTSDGRTVYHSRLERTDRYKVFLADHVFPASGIYTVTIISSKGAISEKLIYTKK
jgi:hypothetical protein